MPPPRRIHNTIRTLTELRTYYYFVGVDNKVAPVGDGSGSSSTRR
eukprot:CAMPEP_0198363320 /NCGR_PEP_ID=MMETSP1450-20131203/149257_1 /TAXON_ID=753684 ORGANISM="Madagascaria erythrocladiodes, Strain CCMP3234" /NCGR_SAMPLE_ID=MMETSP1450 /ASSEMBLY_ACC=CAM_ASM_001115 /LENGTH=44 /DNA_ID= /DNA_START= /DNA_END= /DNA_ORIENTATION=